MKKKHDIVEVDVEIKHETERAYLVTTDGDDSVWLPKSQCEYDGSGTMQMPEWLAKEKGLL